MRWHIDEDPVEDSLLPEPVISEVLIESNILVWLLMLLLLLLLFACTTISLSSSVAIIYFSSIVAMVETWKVFRDKRRFKTMSQKERKYDDDMNEREAAVFVR